MLGDGGELIGNVLLTAVEVASIVGIMEKNSGFIRREPFLEVG
jgi:hypothetical protein